MPSKNNHSHAARPVASAGSLPSQIADNSDFHRLPPMGEADDLLLSAAGDDVVDDLADLDLDDPRFLIVDSPRSRQA